MARKWTEEEKQKQAEAIKRWKPWEKSTGPRTENGKEESRMNAFKHGGYTFEMKVLRHALKLHRDFLSGSHEWFNAQRRIRALQERTINRTNKNKGL